MSTHDAIVVGGGHNGLVTAVYLARAGWRPLVVERNEEIGGAVRSAEITEDGFVHDVYSTNMNLFLDSPVYDDLGDELSDHGLEFAHSEKPFCNVFPDDTCLRVYGDRQRTYDEFRSHHPADGEGWRRLQQRFDRFQRTLMRLYWTTLPSAKAIRVVAESARELGVSGLLADARFLLNSPRELGRAYLESPEARTVVASWGLHADFGPDVSGGSMLSFVETFDFGGGVSIATGGASEVVDALAAIFRDYGGEIRTNAEVAQVLTNEGRAVGVELSSGERLRAERCVVANLTPAVLFDDLLDEYPFAPDVRRRIDDYQYGPGTMMIHLSLDELPRWKAAAELDEFAYVHVDPYVSDMATSYTQAMNGQIPESPSLIVGQTTAVDPTRTPNDEDILWIQVRALPSEIQGDAAGEIEATEWDEAKEPVADRVIGKLERYTSGLSGDIRERVVLSPADLERSNPNLVGGDSVGGSHHLRQNFLFRPFPGYSRYEMPIDDLYMVGAGTWPGAGNNAASGYLAAQRILRPGVRARLFDGVEAVLDGVGRSR